MRKLIFVLIISTIFCSRPLHATEQEITNQEKNQNKDEDEKLLDRIDFGNSYIMGQTIKSGAVYLLQRKQSEIKNMLKYRKDYRKEILEDFVVREDRTEGEILLTEKGKGLK